jgi:DNA/RNA-binding domain of Phe-tRNA-synthetase-like protein
MKLKISEQIIEKYPELEIGVVIVKGVNNNGNEKTLLCEIEDKVKNEIESETIKEIPSIAKWKEVYKSFGSKPSKYRNSAEALLKSALTRGIPTINRLVDIYNHISLKYKMTVGGEDVEKIEGDLVLDFAKGDEEFYSIGSEENDSPKEGEVVYKDDKGIVCRRWNWREADRTKLTEETKDAVVVIENLISEESGKLKEALEEMKSLIEEKGGAECEIKILYKNSLEVEI